MESKLKEVTRVKGAVKQNVEWRKKKGVKKTKGSTKTRRNILFI